MLCRFVLKEWTQEARFGVHDVESRDFITFADRT